MKLTFKMLCELGTKAREIARKIGVAFAALFLKAQGVCMNDAMLILVKKPLMQ
jgi:hypothetical protein